MVTQGSPHAFPLRQFQQLNQITDGGTIRTPREQQTDGLMKTLTSTSAPQTTGGVPTRWGYSKSWMGYCSVHLYSFMFIWKITLKKIDVGVYPCFRTARHLAFGHRPFSDGVWSQVCSWMQAQGCGISLDSSLITLTRRNYPLVV